MQCWKAVSKYKSKWVFETHVWNTSWNASLKCKFEMWVWGAIWNVTLIRKLKYKVEIYFYCNFKILVGNASLSEDWNEIWNATLKCNFEMRCSNTSWYTILKCKLKCKFEVQDWNACCNANLQFNLNARLKCRFEMQVECTFEKQF